MKGFFAFIISVCFIGGFSFVSAQESPKYIATPNEYKVGIEDILDISILQPEKLVTTVTVSRTVP